MTIYKFFHLSLSIPIMIFENANMRKYAVSVVCNYKVH